MSISTFILDMNHSAILAVFDFVKTRNANPVASNIFEYIPGIMGVIRFFSFPVIVLNTAAEEASCWRSSTGIFTGERTGDDGLLVGRIEAADRFVAGVAVAVG